MAAQIRERTVNITRKNHPVKSQNRMSMNQALSWSGQQDSNLRPGVPKTPALPGCAIPRQSPLGEHLFGTPRETMLSRRYTRPRHRQCSSFAVPAPWAKCGAPYSRNVVGSRQRQRRKIGVATRSPGSMPSFLAVPAATSSTARTCPPEGMILSDSVSVFSAIRRMRPSLWMKIMSRET